MASNLNIRLNNRRERTFEHLQEATGENTTAAAIDAASRYYLRMAGGTSVYETGALAELMERAIEQGSVTPAEIADVLDVEEFPIQYSHEWSVGEE